jgi:beta-N-acetylhexosaminidase
LPDETTTAPGETPRAVVLGCAGERLSADESRFFGAANPVGFILFRRNCRSRDQVRELVAALRCAIGRTDAPILIDQEGGRVARLRPPSWRLYPSAACLGSLPDPQAETAVQLGARLIAEDLRDLGITVDCMPVLDVPVAGAHPVIGDRAYGTEPALVTKLGRAACRGLLEGGILPVIKHIPGHGRARVDSHHACPVVETETDELSRTDFAPFRALAAMPWAMSAHIIYGAIDRTAPATLSHRVISEVIRGVIGFDGVLVSDDLSMHALGGDIAERAGCVLGAGCDLVLHCNGDRREMEALVRAARPISNRTAKRLARAEAMRHRSRLQEFDRRGAEEQFEALLTGCGDG